MSPLNGTITLQARARRRHETLAYYLSIPTVWDWQFFHNTQGILCVLDITRFRPLPAGLISLQHPWATGLNPATGEPIWHQNVLYRSPRSAEDYLPSDEAVVQRVGEYLAQMAALSVVFLWLA